MKVNITQSAAYWRRAEELENAISRARPLQTEALVYELETHLADRPDDVADKDVLNWLWSMGVSDQSTAHEVMFNATMYVLESLLPKNRFCTRFVAAAMNQDIGEAIATHGDRAARETGANEYKLLATQMIEKGMAGGTATVADLLKVLRYTRDTLVAELDRESAYTPQAGTMAGAFVTQKREGASDAIRLLGVTIVWITKLVNLM